MTQTANIHNLDLVRVAAERLASRHVSLPGIAELPLAERFQRCPWGLYHIEVIQT